MSALVHYDDPARSGAQAALHEVLTLRLGAEEYAINILHVQELRRYEAPTRIAGAAEHVLGVLNLRGAIVPTVDLRRRLGLSAGFDAETVTVVLNIGGRTVGAVVDAVSDVVRLTADDIKPIPAFSAAQDTSGIAGVATLGEGASRRMLILMQIDALLGEAFEPLSAALQ